MVGVLKESVGSVFSLNEYPALGCIAFEKTEYPISASLLLFTAIVGYAKNLPEAESSTRPICIGAPVVSVSHHCTADLVGFAAAL